MAQSQRCKKKILAIESKVEGFLIEFEHFRQLYGFAVSLPQADQLALALDPENEVIAVALQDRLKHTYLIGTTGCGKSKLMESMILQDLICGRGGALIDPFGELYQGICQFVFHYEQIRLQYAEIVDAIGAHITETIPNPELVKDFKKYMKPRIHDKWSTLLDVVCRQELDFFPPLNVKMIDCSKEANETSPNPYRINPFEPDHPKETLSELVDVFRASIDRHTQSTDLNTPQLASVLEAIFSVAIVDGRELDDVRRIISELRSLSTSSSKSRSQTLEHRLFSLLEDSRDETAKQAAWYLREQLLKFSPHEFTNVINSTVNRLRLLFNPSVISLLGTPKTTLNLTREINSTDKRRPFLLFNLPSHEKGSSMLATYLLSKIDKIIFRRSAQEKELPFFVYVDEFHEFIDDQLAENFAKVRQFGLGYIIAHQNYDQLKKDDPEGYRKGCIFKNTATKLVFRVAGEDAEYIANNCFHLSGELEKVTYSNSEGETVAIGYNVGESYQKAVSKHVGRTSSTSQAESQSESQTESSGEFQGFSQTQSVSHASFENSSEGMSWQRSLGSTVGESMGWDSSSGMPIRYSHSSGAGSSIMAMQNHGFANSSTKGDGYSGGTQRSNSTGTSRSKSLALSEGTTQGESEASSVGVSNQKLQQLAKSETKTVSHEFYGLKEEQMFLAQSVKALPDRELFISFPGLVIHRARTFDSVIAKLDKELAKYKGRRFYPYLLSQQAKIRHEMQQLLMERTKRIPEEKAEVQVEEDDFFF